jgi:hypothetical protein
MGVIQLERNQLLQSRVPRSVDGSERPGVDPTEHCQSAPAVRHRDLTEFAELVEQLGFLRALIRRVNGQQV